jgi:extradiol dioxygenase family protein
MQSYISSNIKNYPDGIFKLTCNTVHKKQRFYCIQTGFDIKRKLNSTNWVLFLAVEHELSRHDQQAGSNNRVRKDRFW